MKLSNKDKEELFIIHFSRHISRTTIENGVSKKLININKVVKGNKRSIKELAWYCSAGEFALSLGDYDPNLCYLDPNSFLHYCNLIYSCLDSIEKEESAEFFLDFLLRGYMFRSEVETKGLFSFIHKINFEHLWYLITERTKEVSDYLAFLLFKENTGLTTLEGLGQYMKDDGEWDKYFIF